MTRSLISAFVKAAKAVTLAALLASFAFASFALAFAAQAAPIQVTDDRGKTTQLLQPAQRVVSLLPSLTETVCALQACARLVGVDRYSDWPNSVRSLPQLGGLEDTQIERLVALKPDLVLAAGSTRAIARLESLGIQVLALEPRSLADTRRVMATVAAALGTPQGGDAAWAQMEQRISAAAARVHALQGQRVYFEVASTPFAAGEGSYLGELLTRLGMFNVVPALLGPFPQLSPEFVVRAQPDVLMATQQAVAEMPARPGWRQLRAVQAARYCAFSPAAFDVLMRPGPRLGEATDVLADCLVALGKIKP
jgi:iron complex transport system substrate-binding protein